jgi:dephospho-CoA kinase
VDGDVTALRVGLTGGIGSGKSTVAAILTTIGATLIDADAISRATTARGGSAVAALEVAFGSQLLTPERALDRDKMRALVFSDPGAKTRLEEIIHPLVGSEIANQTRAAEEVGAQCIVFDIPLLVESSHWRRNLHRILVVDCTLETQIERVVVRSAMTPDEIQRIAATQVSRARRLRAADYVLFNDGITVSDLESQVKQLGALFGL